MSNESKRQQEIEELARRMEYLNNTDQLSISEKIAIARKALEIIERNESNNEEM
jgi:hypothetical protein